MKESIDDTEGKRRILLLNYELLNPITNSHG